MIEGEFQDPVRAKSMRFSHGYFGLVVQTLHDAAGEQFLGTEIVEDEFAMVPERAGDFLHGLNAGAHSLPAPLIEELARPSRRVVFPELLERFLEQVSSSRFEVVA